VKNRHKQEIQKHIGNTGGRHKVKGLFGIAHSPQYRAESVVPKDKDNPRKGYGQVTIAFRERFRRSTDKTQYRFPEKEHYYRNNQAQDHKKGDKRGSYSFKSRRVFGAHILTDKHRAAHTEAHNGIGEDKGNLPPDVDAGHALRAAEPAHDNHIRHIVKGLYKIGHQKKDGKKYQFGENLSLG
jgi:hypothetical protein